FLYSHSGSKAISFLSFSQRKRGVSHRVRRYNPVCNGACSCSVAIWKQPTHFSYYFVAFVFIFNRKSHF
ncbi:unnamed protein product, partial [Bubo scandiacus]